MGEETFEQMFRAKVIKPGETVLCVCVLNWWPTTCFILYRLTTCNVNLYIYRFQFFNSILFSISFIFQIHLLTVRNGQYHDRCRNCVWASSAHWIPVNRHSYIAIWPDRICKRNHRKEADSKRRFLSTIKAIYYWSETKGVFPRCRYVDLLDPSNKQKTKSHWSIEWKSSMHLNSPISNHFRRKCLNFFIKKLLSWNARRALPIVSEVKRQKPISE